MFSTTRYSAYFHAILKRYSNYAACTPSQFKRATDILYSLFYDHTTAFIEPVERSETYFATLTPHFLHLSRATIFRNPGISAAMLFFVGEDVFVAGLCFAPLQQVGAHVTAASYSDHQQHHCTGGRSDVI